MERPTSNIQDVGADAHDVIEDARQLAKQNPNVLGPQRHVNVQQLLHCQGVALQNIIILDSN